MAFVLRHYCPEKVIGSVTANDPTRAAQHCNVREIMNFKPEHLALHERLQARV